MDDMSSIIGEFLTESYENLDQLDQHLVDLEANPGEKDLLASIFRTIHTIKGTCGFLGFSKLESVAHVGENLLSKLRDGDLTMTPDIAHSLLAMVDAVREILASIEKDRTEGDVDYSDLVNRIDCLQSGKELEIDKPKTPKTPQKKRSTQSTKKTAVSAAKGSLFERLGGQNTVDVLIDQFFDKVLADKRVNMFFEEVDTERLRNKEKSYWAFALGEGSPYTGKTLGEAHRALLGQGLNSTHFEAMIELFNQSLCEMEIPDALVQEACQIALSTRDEILGKATAGVEPSAPSNEKIDPPEMKEDDRRDVKDRRSGNKKQEEVYLSTHKDRRVQGERRSESIRVDVDILDRLMNLVGELVLARNQMIQFAAAETDTGLHSTTQHLDQLTSELQEGVMKTRMQPIGNIWNKFPRLVRDLAATCGKKVRLEMEGKDTELDKTLIEAIKDPLTHIIRNSVDHGIEMPDERAANGKDPEGRLFLRAYHEGGQVNIDIVDDGGGIDPEKIKAKAISKDLITAQAAEHMNDRELINLIFSPGFSTAESVSNISGRGVGMDVVKTNIEKIGGTVDINSHKGQGTTLKVKIPLTLAIIPALIVACGSLRYAIPQVNLMELVRLENESVIEHIQGSPVYRLRGNLLPLVYLSEVLEVEGQSRSGCVNMVVLQAGLCQFGLLVDAIHDTEEIVVKPLGKQLGEIITYAGATILGDGKVVLILDAMGLAQKAHVVGQESREQTRKAIRDQEEAQNIDRQPLLVFSPGSETRMAVPLSMVARLEEFNLSLLEDSDGQKVVQYRGEIMPLVFLSDIFDMSSSREEEGIMRVIVYSDRGRNVGVVVDKIIDIVEEAVTLKKGSVGQGLLGSTVVQEKVTDLLDVEDVIRRVDPEFSINQTVAATNNIE